MLDEDTVCRCEGLEGMMGTIGHQLSAQSGMRKMLFRLERRWKLACNLPMLLDKLDPMLV